MQSLEVCCKMGNIRKKSLGSHPLWGHIINRSNRRERRPRRSDRRRRQDGILCGHEPQHRTRRNAGDGVPYA